MSAIRTQVYFTRELRDGLDARASAEDKPLAEVVREAAGAYLADDDSVVQVRLPANLRRDLDRAARRTGGTREEVIEAALTEHLSQHRPNGAAVTRAMHEAFGSMPELDVASRDEWDRGDRWPDG